MKKIYKTPLTEVADMSAEQMICDSPLSTVDGLDGVGKGGDFPGGSADDKYFDDEDVFDELW